MIAGSRSAPSTLVISGVVSAVGTCRAAHGFRPFIALATSCGMPVEASVRAQERSLRTGTAPSQILIGSSGRAVLVAPLPLRGQRRNWTRVRTGFPIIQGASPRPRRHDKEQDSTRCNSDASSQATQLCQITTPAIAASRSYFNAAQIASSPSVSAAGPGCRMSGDLISTMRAARTAGTSSSQAGRSGPGPPSCRTRRRGSRQGRLPTCSAVTMRSLAAAAPRKWANTSTPPASSISSETQQIPEISGSSHSSK